MTATVTLSTASLIVSNLRSIIKDYNYWGTSESDSPLSIRRTKSLTDAQILVADAAMRRKVGGANYQVPSNRSIACKTLLEVFTPLVESSKSEISAVMGTIENLRLPAESLEFYVQLYSTFQQLTETKVCFVDAPNDAFVGLFITGKTTDEIVVAQALLVQT
ncbi:hypothetical protein [Microcoleus sp. bin38.metabat.b11b12b14.051]|uniref:hypothetical protein n=1 Tax=Microcoleus sp. bin38.metabat.b11b12b14.051 TaxID=2742709 RepID=UPI0025E15EC2|nr:hypothetical protein [Microcoleus sp. bin38.metabat.b11b12b14.051]